MGKTLTGAYRSSLAWLYGFIDYERTARWKYDGDHFSLDRIGALLADLGNPHREGWHVHVAGTNGKGSVSAMIAKAHSEAGYSTGLYTSPHLISFRERIRVNGRSISRSDVVEGVERVRDMVSVYPGLTFFEVWTALAFDYFRYKKVDASVIEVGMGGRLDSTNVITPAVSVITSISMDHAGILGTTPEEIAREKAGIIKPGVPVVSAPQDPEVLAVIRDAADAAGSPLTVVGEDVKCHECRGGIAYDGPLWKFENLTLPLNSGFQAENSAVALAALEILASSGRTIGENSVRKGIESVRWPGRLQTLSRNPEIIVDGACNVDAMREVSGYIRSKHTRDDVVALTAMCGDKEVGKVLGILGECSSRFVVTQVDNPRALDAGKMADAAPDGINVLVDSSPASALEKAKQMAGNKGVVLATGSLYLAGEVMRLCGVKNLDRI